ncbi:MAG: hypothetical protein M3Q49_04500 [Actinomycetota bacterium]|nr:hypothetical protein [Actinomycetota bacterium]
MRMRASAGDDDQRLRLGEPRMTPQQFSSKWADNELKESAASKKHFLDVCALVGAPTPREADKAGAWFAFEKGVEKGALAGAGHGPPEEACSPQFSRKVRSLVMERGRL